MKNSQNSFDFKVILQNIMAGLAVSFVALSLGAAFGIMSGRGALMGMLSASIIALITALIGGTRLQCSGPTAPMTVITAGTIVFANSELNNLGISVSPDHFVNIVFLLTSFLVILMGVLNFGKFISWVPNVVASGFMNGIALLIFADQSKKILEFYQKDASHFLLYFGMVLATIFIVFAIPYFFKKIIPAWAGLISGTLVAIVIMTIIAEFFQLPLPRTELAGGFSGFNDFLNLVKNQIPNLHDFSFLTLKNALPFALELSLLLYLDTLLTSVVIDKIVKEKTKRSKELVAQGVATAAISTFGGIPGSQATIRSVLLVKEGATWRLAGVLVGIFALVEVLLFKNFVSLIPQAVFTGVLFKVGYDVLDLLPIRLYLKELLRNYHQLTHKFFSRHDDEKIFVTNREIILIMGTALTTLFTNLMIAVGVFTGIFYICNLWIWKKNPIRDLKPHKETDVFIVED